MQPVAMTILSMELDASILLWIGAVLLVLGLFFALAGRRPTRREHERAETEHTLRRPVRKKQDS